MEGATRHLGVVFGVDLENRAPAGRARRESVRLEPQARSGRRRRTRCAGGARKGKTSVMTILSREQRRSWLSLNS